MKYPPMIYSFKMLDTILAPRNEFVPQRAEIMKVAIGGIPELLSNAQPFKQNDTLVIVQRNAKDKNNRLVEPTSSDFGSLDAGESEVTQSEAKQGLDNLLESIPVEERSTLDVVIVASDASLIMPDGKTSPHRRAIKTAEAVVMGVKDSLATHSLSESQLLSSDVVPVTDLKDLKILDESPAYVNFLKNKYRYDENPKVFWEAYETDDPEDRVVREEMGAEGPNEIANRMLYFYSTLEMMAKDYHDTHPGRRLLVWSVSHYDSISPFLKQTTGKPMEVFLHVPYRQGAMFVLGRQS